MAIIQAAARGAWAVGGLTDQGGWGPILGSYPTPARKSFISQETCQGLRAEIKLNLGVAS